MMTFFTILSFMEFLFKISALFICFSDSFKSLHDILTKAGVPQESIVFTFFLLCINDFPADICSSVTSADDTTFYS